MDSNRDELYYQSDYSFARYLTALFGFHYENERGSYVEPAPYAENEQTQRTNFEYTLQLQGEIKSRVFYSAGGGIEKNHLYGITGAPRLGLSYVPFFPGAKWFRGTLLRANVATGVQEPSLGIQFASLYTHLQEAGDTADIAKYHVTPAGPQDRAPTTSASTRTSAARSWSSSSATSTTPSTISSNRVDAGALEQFFGYSPSVAQNTYQPYLNSLAFRAQGIETELQYRPFSRLFLHGGYTYLDAVVTQSFSSDAYSNGTDNNNPNLPGIAIGAEGPLIGARPFRRPPHTGFFAVQYDGRKAGRGVHGRAGQPLRRLHLPRWLRSELRQHPRPAQPRPRLRLRQARRQPHLRRPAARHRLHRTRQPAQPAAHRPHRLPRPALHHPGGPQTPHRRETNGKHDSRDSRFAGTIATTKSNCRGEFGSNLTP